jgi:hypothetical protein
MQRAILLALVILLAAACPTARSDEADPSKFDIGNDYEMDRRYDWTMDVKVTSAKNYLSYSGSTLKPLTKLLISYKMNPRFSKTPTPFIEYEELWFQQGRAIGCRRLHNLDIPATYQGAIRIIPSTDASENSAAISGAIPRLVLDLALRNCVISMLFVPKDIFQDVIDGLSRHNFYPSTNMVGGGATIHLIFSSNPLGTMQAVDYRS